MAKSRLKPTTSETFAVAKQVGAKEALEEVQELINDGANIQSVKTYIKARIKSLVSLMDTDPFKQKDGK